MTTIALTLQAVRARIERALLTAGRRTGDVSLLAVSKTFPESYIEDALNAGQKAFGESYVQEAVKKITHLARLSPEWHFIGPIQSNKTALIAGHFDWVHSIEREKVAARLNAARADDLPPLNVCIQVNVSGEDSKSGVAPGQERELARAIASLPRLRLRGLMAIPEPTADVARQRRRYALLREMKDALNAEGHALDTLSMGMSDDLEAAIAEGATIVRVGTAIFGTRETLEA
ncbi:MAG: YggS family pyridoxal phosphate-dependent enzyme [Betaproteobacteria bacterium]|nr:YggS family pyridoxal phosphate-dependent enzyme [Betaproteobacteria bacterium]